MTTPIEHRHDTAYRRDSLWTAAFLHRLSGLALALFLPLHFLALGLAIEGEATLDGFLRWTDATTVKMAEIGLVFLLTVHVLGGIRVMLIENMPWRPGQQGMAVTAVVVALAVAVVFAIRVL